MSKKILLTLLISILSANESTSFKDKSLQEKIPAIFLNGVYKGTVGIIKKAGKQLLNTDQTIKNIQEFREENKINHTKWQEHEIKRLKKSVNTLSAERYKYIHLYSQEKDKNRELKKRVAKLEKLITKYHIEEDNKVSARAKAKEDLKRQLRGKSK